MIYGSSCNCEMSSIGERCSLGSVAFSVWKELGWMMGFGDKFVLSVPVNLTMLALMVVIDAVVE